MDVKLPNLGEGADSGTVVNLFIKEGDRIEKDQPLIELENEKAVATIPSTAAGVVARVHVKNGDRISVGQRIVSLTADGEGAATAAKADEKGSPPQAGKPAPPTVAEAPAAEVAPQPVAASFESSSPPAAAPSLRRLADDLGIDLTRVRGSARGSRIVLADMKAYIQGLIKAAQSPESAAKTPSVQKPPSESIDFSRWGRISKKPMSSLRKVISRRMLESWNAIPQVTQFEEADLTRVLELRKQYAAAYERQGARLTVTSFLLRAVVTTLRQHPIFNSSLDEAAEEIVYKEYYHLGIAVDTEAGLIVPVIRDADKMSLAELSRELEAVAKKARDRKVSAEELKGGTFTISNQGGIGGGWFTPIVNKPEVGILGLGRAVLKPVVKNDLIVPRMMLPIGLSADHRVIDGGAAARFMVDLLRAVENFGEEDVKV